MTSVVYVEDFAPYRYLVEAMLRVKPIEQLQVRPYHDLDHPIVGEQTLTSIFMAYQDEGKETAFSFLAIAEALDRKYTEVRLCGETPLMRGVVRSACQIIDEGQLMLAASHIYDFPGYNEPMWHEGSQAPDAMLETYFKKLKIVEAYTSGDTFLLGDKPYLPDVILAACCWYSRDIGLAPIPEGLPRLKAWYQRHSESGVFRHPNL